MSLATPPLPSPDKPVGLSWCAKTSIVCSHAIPLLGLIVFDWSAWAFLILGLFHTAFSVVNIGVVGVATTSRQETPGDQPWAWKAAFWLTMAGASLFISLLLTTLLGWVIVLVASESEGPLLTWQLAGAALSIVVTALPAIRRQYLNDLAAGLDEETRKRREQPRVKLLVMSCGLYFLLGAQGGAFGRTGLIVVASLITSAFIFRDLSPGLASILFPAAAKSPAEPSNPKAHRKSKKSGR